MIILTDGVIQRVFKLYHVDTHNYEYKASVNDINNLISRLQKDIIKNIKLEILSLYEQNPDITGGTLKTIQKALIGNE